MKKISDKIKEDRMRCKEFRKEVEEYVDNELEEYVDNELIPMFSEIIEGAKEPIREIRART